MVAAGDGRWAQPGDEFVGVPEPSEPEEAEPEYLDGDAEQASARRRAALEAEAARKNVCPGCGAEVDPGVRRCPTCDTLVVGVGNCPVCGSLVDDLTPNCPDCGTPNPRIRREQEL